MFIFSPLNCLYFEKKRINIVTLGCSKNLVDSEHLMAQLDPNAFEITFDDNTPEADVVIVNTCGFIGDAKEESIDTILSFARAREAGQIDQLFVMGCLSERYKKDLESEIPEVDQYFGVNNLADILRAVGGHYRDKLRGERHLTTPAHYAYLKISEGCNWGCGYCAIPLIRGRHVSVRWRIWSRSRKSRPQRGSRIDRYRPGYHLLWP